MDKVPSFEDMFFKMAQDDQELKKISSAPRAEDDFSYQSGGYDYNFFGDDGESVKTKKVEVVAKQTVPKVEKTVVSNKIIKQVKKEAKPVTESDLFGPPKSSVLNLIPEDTDDSVGMYLRQTAMKEEKTKADDAVLDTVNDAGIDIVSTFGEDWTVAKDIKLADLERNVGLTKTASTAEVSYSGGGGGGGGGSRGGGYTPTADVVGSSGIQVNRANSGPIDSQDVVSRMQRQEDLSNLDADNMYINKKDLYDAVYGDDVESINNGDGARMSFTQGAIQAQGGIVKGGGGVGLKSPVAKTVSVPVNNALASQPKAKINRFESIED